MNYLSVVEKAFIFFPFIAFFITIPYILYQYHKYGSINKLRTLIIYSFFLYLLVIYFLVILPLPDKEVVKNMTSSPMQLIPFHFISDFIKETPLVITNPKTYLSAIKHSSFYVVIFNIFMTIPFGMYLRYYFKCSKKKTILYTFMLSLFFEVTQLTGLYYIYPRAYRLFDVDDLILNTLGGLIGYHLMKFFKKLPTRDEIDKKSKEKGKEISPLRRFTLFFLDLFIFSAIYFLTTIISDKTFIPIFIIYYILIPLIFNNTLAGMYLNIKIEYQNKYLGTILRPIIIYLTYYKLLGLIITIFNYMNTILNNKIISYIISFYLLLVLSAINLVNIINIFHKKDTLYDKLLKAKYISLIK